MGRPSNHSSHPPSTHPTPPSVPEVGPPHSPPGHCGRMGGHGEHLRGQAQGRAYNSGAHHRRQGTVACQTDRHHMEGAIALSPCAHIGPLPCQLTQGSSAEVLLHRSAGAHQHATSRPLPLCSLPLLPCALILSAPSGPTPQQALVTHSVKHMGLALAWALRGSKALTGAAPLESHSLRPSPRQCSRYLSCVGSECIRPDRPPLRGIRGHLLRPALEPMRWKKQNSNSSRTATVQQQRGAVWRTSVAPPGAGIAATTGAVLEPACAQQHTKCAVHEVL